MNEEAIERMKDITNYINENSKYKTYGGYYIRCRSKEAKMFDTVLNLIENQKAEIEKKDKIIDLMSEEIAFNYDINSYADVITIKKQLKEKYEKKAEEDK